MNEEIQFQRLRECIKRDPQLLYIYYSGHSDAQGNWCPDSVSQITLEKLLHVLKPYSKKVMIVSDCSFSGHWIKKASKLYKED